MAEELRLKGEEKVTMALRSLYTSYGYRPYKMSRFEEYDLYAGNKDFLVSESEAAKRSSSRSTTRAAVEVLFRFWPPLPVPRQNSRRQSPESSSSLRLSSRSRSMGSFSSPGSACKDRRRWRRLP